MPVYYIDATEFHSTTYTVEANTPERAVEMMQEGQATRGMDSQFNCLSEPDTWMVEDDQGNYWDGADLL